MDPTDIIVILSLSANIALAVMWERSQREAMATRNIIIGLLEGELTIVSDEDGGYIKRVKKRKET